MNLQHQSKLSDLDWKSIVKKQLVRLRVAHQSFYWFFHLYFGRYIEYPTADFQKQMMAEASDPNLEHLVIMAFRESGKSTLMTTAFPLWAITGVLKKKYVVIVSQTQKLAQQHLKNIADELDSNELLHKDFWPYDTEKNQLGLMAINLPKFGAKIIAVSREQGVRGLRHGPHRPDLIISDDVEDTGSVKTKESRANTFDWFTGEILPLGSSNTKYITVGNLLHEDSLLMRLKAGFEHGSRNGKFLEFPIIVKRKSLWVGRFPDMTAIKKLKRRIDNRITWEREYMLRLIPDDDQIITPDMIHSYSELPPILAGQQRRIIIGVDLAVTQNDWSDYTAIVTLDVRGTGDRMRMYVLPNPFNKRILFPETLEILRAMNKAYRLPRFYIEQTGYQAAVPQQLSNEGLNAVGVSPQADKRTRLNLIADKIQRGVILFPEKGAKELKTQLFGFGVEMHEDLVDALTAAVIEDSLHDKKLGTVRFSRHDILGRDRLFPHEKRGWTRLMG